MFEGQFAEGQFAEGQFAEGQFAEGQFADGQFEGTLLRVFEPELVPLCRDPAPR
jgi:hypothetical protein